MMKLVKIFSKQTYKGSGMRGMDDRHSSSTEIRGAFWGIHLASRNKPTGNGTIKMPVTPSCCISSLFINH